MEEMVVVNREALAATWLVSAVFGLGSFFFGIIFILLGSVTEGKTLAMTGLIMLLIPLIILLIFFFGRMMYDVIRGDW